MKKSLWVSTSQREDYEKLKNNIKADYLIIGGGIVGITAAYILSKNKLRVVLVDANKIGEGCSGRTTGKITCQHSVIYSKLKKKYNLDVAKAYYKANNEAIDFIEKIVKENKINCDFEILDSYIFTEDIVYLKELKTEYNVCKEIGIKCEYHDDLDIPFEVKGAIAFKNQGQFNPKKYIDALGKIIVKNGGVIYENTPIVDIEKEDNCYKFLSEDKNEIVSKKVIFASHSPWYDDLGLYFARLRPERSYLVSGVIKEESIRIPKGMYINIEEPRRSFRYYNNEGENLLLIGGENHKVGKDNKEDSHYKILKEVGKEKFNITDFNYKWSAQDYMTTDQLPYIGYLNIKNKDVYVGTGFSKWGMTNGIAAAIIISDSILNKQSDYEDTFSVNRLGDILSLDMIKQNLEVGYEYIKGKFNLGNESVDLEVGKARIIKIKGKKYGAYKDKDNKIYIVDITCTHLGCELTFNKEEKSWDCPCHGSRFDFKGEILEGPATEKLNKYGDCENNINPHIL